MINKLILASLVFLMVGCLPPPTFETNLQRWKSYRQGSSSFMYKIKNMEPSIVVRNFSYANFKGEWKDHKKNGFHKVQVDSVLLISNVWNGLNSVFGTKLSQKKLRKVSFAHAINEVNDSLSSVDWNSYTNRVSILANDSLQASDYLIEVIGRTITYSSIDMTAEMGVPVPTGVLEYFSATRWTVLIFHGPEEIYRGNARFKDYTRLPEEQPFEYNLSQENIEKLTSLALQDYFNYIKTN